MLLWQLQRITIRSRPGFGCRPSRSSARPGSRLPSRSPSRGTRTPCGGRSRTAAPWRSPCPPGPSMTRCACSRGRRATWSGTGRWRSASRSASSPCSTATASPSSPRGPRSSSWGTRPGCWADGSPRKLGRPPRSRSRPSCLCSSLPSARLVPIGAASLVPGRPRTARRRYQTPWSGPLLPGRDPHVPYPPGRGGLGVFA